MGIKYPNRVEVKLTDEQLKRLTEVSKKLDLDRSDTMRHLINVEYEHEHGVLNPHLLRRAPVNLSGDEHND